MPESLSHNILSKAHACAVMQSSIGATQWQLGSVPACLWVSDERLARLTAQQGMTIRGNVAHNYFLGSVFVVLFARQMCGF